MVKWLIELVGKAIAKDIERGSTKGAWAGAALGIAIALAAGYVLGAAASLDSYRIAIYLILGVPMGIVGAVIGARIGPRRRIGDVRNELRLTNINVAGGLLAVALGFGVAFTFTILTLADHTPQKAGEIDPKYNPYICAGMGILFCISAWMASAVPWSVNLGEWITVRRLFGSRVYQRNSLRAWRFQDENGRAYNQPPADDAFLFLLFDDDRRYNVRIAASASQAVAEILAPARVKG